MRRRDTVDEATLHRIAWAAVKRSSVKVNGVRRRRAE
jgi:cation transport regulator ChaB